ncbi:hypothetical protein JQC72_04765 [Polycladomyces sp. WAk]|uniref:ABC transporter permease n=1 Tax=Polycladomyces zharkentensis TaxID=2807616 RepID=A0ABS2WHM7_9BACL|nr:hypothetical protein [Polycladomyces sp. WAk]MBN2908835.1 hypothetical protein [Polycladomyces sp. WAk]
MKGKISILFDWKSMGIQAYIPMMAMVLLFLYTLTVKDALPFIIPALEYVTPIFSAWWSIFLFYDLLEEPGSETIFTYPVSRWKLGVVRVGVFFLFYVLLLEILLFAIEKWTAPGIWEPMSVQLIAESYFFCGLGFLAMAMTMNTGWSLMFPIVYSSTQILTKGALLPVVNIYAFNQEPLTWDELPAVVFKSVLLGTVFIGGAQYLIHHMRRFH